MLELNQSLLIGKGLDRECYLHPEDADKCIKVTVSGNYRQSNNELKCYGWMTKRKVSFENLIRLHGVVQTNIGDGLVFDVVRDFDDNISKTLHHYLDALKVLDSQADEGVPTLDTLQNQVAHLRSYLLEQQIIMRDLKESNLLWQKGDDGGGKLIIVDGVGNSEFIPVSNFIQAMRLRKISRKWNKFERQLRARYDW